ncbi:MAG: hypothetical protein RLZZ584_619 [Pseudomonadota bacterium]
MLLTGLALALTGCGSVSLVYGQGGNLGYWWLDRYVDFNAEQAPRARAALADWFSWHRRNALADDIAWLEQRADEVAQELTPAQVCAWFDQLRQRRAAYLAPLLPATTALAATLEPRQLEHIAQRQASRNDDWRDDHLQPRPADRLDADAKRIRERAEMFYGRLDAAQRRYIVERLKGNTPWSAERWYADMLADQAALLEALRGVARQGPTGPAAAALAAALQQPGAAADAATLAWREQLQAYQCAYTAELHRRTTPEQRANAARTLRGWAQDLRAFLPAAAPG